MAGCNPEPADAVRTAATAADWAGSAGVPLVWVRVERLPDNCDAPGADTDFARSRPPSTKARLVAGAPGAELVAPLARRDGDLDVVKRRVSAFYATPLEV